MELNRKVKFSRNSQFHKDLQQAAKELFNQSGLEKLDGYRFELTFIPEEEKVLVELLKCDE